MFFVLGFSDFRRFVQKSLHGGFGVTQILLAQVQAQKSIDEFRRDVRQERFTVGGMTMNVFAE